MRPEYFDGMQMHEDSAVMAALRWDNLWSCTCRGCTSSPLYEDPAEVRSADRPCALDICITARNFTHESSTCAFSDDDPGDD